ncbi:putative membrane protein YdfK [Virgibacillus dokdonensis]|nr:putative membrane protein YdfK [Virgibacillus dokdonensis]
MQGIGLAVLLIGLQMAFVTEQIIVVLLSLLMGAVIGEWLRLEDRLNQLGKWVGNQLGSKEDDTRVSQGFVTASLIFVIGAMAIIGALDSGLRGDHEVLITKGILDGFVSLVLTTTLGFGVILSVIPVLLYQGSIALLATQIEGIVPKAYLDGFITEVTGVGGLLIIAIGLNLLNITSIRIGNLLPAVIMVGFVYSVYLLFL